MICRKTGKPPYRALRGAGAAAFCLMRCGRLVGLLSQFPADFAKCIREKASFVPYETEIMLHPEIAQSELAQTSP